MKRAVSSIDATARGPPNTPQYKLKRCKSAFANLKRLGGAVTASPTTPPLAGRCSGDPSGMGWAVGEEISLPPCWRQHASPTDVNVKASSAATAPPIRSFAPGSRCSDVSFSYNGSTSSAFFPQQRTTGLRGAGRRLFGISGTNGQEHPLTTGTQEAMVAENDACRGGRSSRTMSSRMNSSFASTFNFSPVPEGEVSTDDELEPTHCPFLQLHRRQDSVIGARVTTTVSSIDIGGGSGRESPTGSDRHTEEGDGCGGWTDPGSPASSIVGFDGAEDDDGEDGDARDGVEYSATSSASPTRVERQSAMRSSGSVSCLEGNEQANYLVPDSRHEAAAAAAVEAWSPSWTTDTPNHSVNGAKASSSSSSNKSSTSSPSSGSPVSPILLLHLQRRFEEMLLISNVAT